MIAGQWCFLNGTIVVDGNVEGDVPARSSKASTGGQRYLHVIIDCQMYL
jgi:hypothetical protein